MTIKAYHIESAYNNYTGKTVEEDIGAYEKFVDKFLEALPFKIYRDRGHPILWIVMNCDTGFIFRTWRYYEDNYNMSDDEYEEGCAGYNAEECDVPRYLYEPSFIGELK